MPDSTTATPAVTGSPPASALTLATHEANSQARADVITNKLSKLNKNIKGINMANGTTTQPAVNVFGSGLGGTGSSTGGVMGGAFGGGALGAVLGGALTNGGLFGGSGNNTQVR